MRRLKQRATFVAVVGLSLSLYGFRHQAAPPDLTSPKATVRSFLKAITARDSDALAACVQGASNGPRMKRFLEERSGPFSTIAAADPDNMIVEGTDDKVKVATQVTLSIVTPGAVNEPKLKVALVEMFTLQRENDKWRIVAEPNAIMADKKFTPTPQFQMRPLAAMAAAIALPQPTAAEAEAEHRDEVVTTCISNEKQIATGILMYVQDYDEQFPRRKASYKELIFPYVKNNEIFRCPLDAKGTLSYRINPNMQDAALAAIVEPASTVLLYEGKNMKFDFKHDGKTAVAFADGHVKMMTPEQTKEVFWYPEGKTPHVKIAPNPKPKTGKKK